MSDFHAMNAPGRPARFSYVIPYRSDVERVRAANLQAILRWLSRLPDLEVVLVEQDRASTVDSNNLPPNCNHIFAENSGPFNKSWGLNIGFKHSSGLAIGFGDADLITNPQALMHCFDACYNGIDAVKPYDQLVDLTRAESRTVLDGDNQISVVRNKQKPNREGKGEFVSFCGGLFLMRRSVYEQLGGFDERFLGWGGEDDAMTIKLSRLVTNTRVLTNQPAFHLWHERSHASRYGHPHYQQNVARLKHYAACDISELQSLCAQDRTTMGDLRKYATG